MQELILDKSSLDDVASSMIQYGTHKPDVETANFIRELGNSLLAAPWCPPGGTITFFGLDVRHYCLAHFFFNLNDGMCMVDFNVERVNNKPAIIHIELDCFLARDPDLNSIKLDPDMALNKPVVTKLGDYGFYIQICNGISRSHIGFLTWLESIFALVRGNLMSVAAYNECIKDTLPIENI